MRVNKEDGCCRECGGELLIVDADDCSMQVICLDCGADFRVEPDAFADGAMHYFVGFHVKRWRQQDAP